MVLKFGYLVMNKDLKQWLAESRVQIYTTSKKEIENLFKVVERDIKDASIEALSWDRRYATAYNAALQLATIVAFASGYRVKAAVGHHWITLSLIPIFMGKSQQERADYLDVCRSKRNVTDYTHIGEVSVKEVNELLNEVKKFKLEVVTWLKKQHPQYFS